ncbi:hypothetical protein [Cryobacterium sp. M91]|uniref:hypothetical protein n=1 Tax=Cryobacterium sp. M91 TaxID=2048294 RepID=UPI000CE2B768|nr:hypothetical protein [Cryobacterium sp. M91]
MSVDEDSDRGALSGIELEKRMVEIAKGHELAGYHPDGDALDRAKRILTGELSEADAWAEIDAKWDDGGPDAEKPAR